MTDGELEKIERVAKAMVEFRRSRTQPTARTLVDIGVMAERLPQVASRLVKEVRRLKGVHCPACIAEEVQRIYRVKTKGSDRDVSDLALAWAPPAPAARRRAAAQDRWLSWPLTWISPLLDPLLSG